jgi:hypothetical protein
MDFKAVGGSVEGGEGPTVSDPDLSLCLVVGTVVGVLFLPGVWLFAAAMTVCLRWILPRKHHPTNLPTTSANNPATDTTSNRSLSD